MRRKGRRKKWDREYAVGRARRLLNRRGRPRVQLALLLVLTGCAGFLLSSALLRAGLAAMWLRYPLVILLSYGVLLLLLWAWLGVQRKGGGGPDVDLDVAEVFSPVEGGRGGGTAGRSGFAGGMEGSGRHGGGPGILDAVDVDLAFDVDGGDEGCLVVFAVVALAAAVVAGMLSAFYLVWVAPALLAEVLVDGLLVTGLYRKVKDLEGRHWLRAAVRRTVVPVALTLLFFTAAGYLMQKAAPEAHSIAGFWEAVTSGRPDGGRR
ncbi:MAG TPA: hypothetical protein VGX48_24375 [Pyrinomonadaceae bacterium]|jgi:hypothetical protein|nr:hypothetical protein [Pyrinomonadaceae bacterium]